MKTLNFLISSAIALSALACEPKAPKLQNVGPVYEKSQITVQTLDNSSGRIRAVDAQGRVVLDAALLDPRSKVFQPTRGFIAFTVTVQGRKYLRTFNYRGEEIQTKAIPLSRKAIVKITDSLIAFTSSQEGGLRLYTFTVDGIPVNTSSTLLDVDSEITTRDEVLYYTTEDGVRMMVSPAGQVSEVPRRAGPRHR